MAGKRNKYLGMQLWKNMTRKPTPYFDKWLIFYTIITALFIIGEGILGHGWINPIITLLCGWYIGTYGTARLCQHQKK